MRHNIRPGLVTFSLIVLLLSACVSPDETTPSAPPHSPLTVGESPLQQPTAPTEALPSDDRGIASQLTSLAADDLSRLLSIDPARITVVSTREVEMSQQGLGCGPFALTDQPEDIVGKEIVLQVADKRFVYRSDGEHLIRCTDGTDVMAVRNLFQMARDDLAAELGVESGGIALIKVEPMQWRDSSLGCPKSGMSYLQVITPGYRLTLEANGQLYTYHTDGGKQAVRCDPGD